MIFSEIENFEIELGDKDENQNDEKKKDGEIGWKNLWRYIKMSNAVPFFYIFIVLKLSAVCAYMLSDLGKGRIIFQDVKM